jgi:hypothetical protein
MGELRYAVRFPFLMTILGRVTMVGMWILRANFMKGGMCGEERSGEDRVVSFVDQQGLRCHDRPERVEHVPVCLRISCRFITSAELGNQNSLQYLPAMHSF